jgi:plastocyanin
MRPIVIIGAAAALMLAGCGSSNKSSSSQATATATPTATATQGTSGGGGGQTVQVAADAGGALKFTTATLKAKAGSVSFEFNNPSQVPHAFAVEGNGVDQKGKTVTGGKDTLTVTLKPGKYEFYCPVDAHKAAGMKGTLTVS